MKCYIGAKLITAEPEPHADGRPGYRVIYPDGYSSWSPQSTFEIAYREITFHERQLMVQTDAEHQIGAISDGDPNTPSHEHGCNWLTTTVDECEFRATHNYCPHPEHACDCK